jgi:hypothetical protein
VVASKRKPPVLEGSGSVTRYELRRTNGAPAKPVRAIKLTVHPATPFRSRLTALCSLDVHDMFS